MSESIYEKLYEAVYRVYSWQYHPTGNFYDMLFDLFQKADDANKKKVERVFSIEYQAWKQWREANDKDRFFREWGVLNGFGREN